MVFVGIPNADCVKSWKLKGLLTRVYCSMDVMIVLLLSPVPDADTHKLPISRMAELEVLGNVSLSYNPFANPSLNCKPIMTSSSPIPYVHYLFAAEPGRNAALRLSSLLLDRRIELIDLLHRLRSSISTDLLRLSLSVLELGACAVGLATSVSLDLQCQRVPGASGDRMNRTRGTGTRGGKKTALGYLRQSQSSDRSRYRPQRPSSRPP